MKELKVGITYRAGKLIPDKQWEGQTLFYQPKTFKGTIREVVHQAFEYMKAMEKEECKILYVSTKYTY